MSNGLRIPPEGVAITIPAPFRGINALDEATAVAADEARELENWLPDGPECRIRPGKEAHCDTGESAVGTLVAFEGESATTLIAAAGGNILDVTGASPSTLATGYTSNVWSTAQLNGYMVAVNGTDTPWRFNGSAVSATGFSGVTLTTLRTVAEANERLWFTVNGSADVYYAQKNAISGELTKFQLSQLVKGGYCSCIFGFDDYTAFWMSTGQLLVYAGDPDEYGDFAIRAKYTAPAPAGTRPALQLGGEVILLTAVGPMPLSAVRDGSAFSTAALTHWAKIGTPWVADYALYKALDGWGALLHEGLLYINVPTSTTSAKQYVLNTRNNAWTTYSNLDACQWAANGSELYFGELSSGYVRRHGGGLDGTDPIVPTSRQGFTSPTGGSRDVRFTMARFNVTCSGIAEAQFALDVDFKEESLSNRKIFSLQSAGSGGDWGDDWGGDWGVSGTGKRHWQKARGRGRAVAPVFRVYSQADKLVWHTTEIVVTRAGLL